MWHTHPGYTTGAGDPILCRIHILYLFYEFYWTVEHLCLVVWQVQIGCHEGRLPYSSSQRSVIFDVLFFSYSIVRYILV
jgi:hypothetical protein